MKTVIRLKEAKLGPFFFPGCKREELQGRGRSGSPKSAQDDERSPCCHHLRHSAEGGKNKQTQTNKQNWVDLLSVCVVWLTAPRPSCPRLPLPPSPVPLARPPSRGLSSPRWGVFVIVVPVWDSRRSHVTWWWRERQGFAGRSQAFHLSTAARTRMHTHTRTHVFILVILI